MTQRNHQEKLCDAMPETELEEDAMTGGVSVIVEQLLGGLTMDGAGAEHGAFIHSKETIRYLLQFSIEIGNLIALSDQSADQIGLLAGRIRTRMEEHSEQNAGLSALSEHIQGLAETAHQSAGNIRIIVDGIQEKVQGLVVVLEKLDQAAAFTPDNIRAIATELNQILSGIDYVVRDYRSIGSNAKKVLEEAEAGLRLLNGPEKANSGERVGARL